MIVYQFNDPNFGSVKQWEVLVTSNAPYYVFDVRFYAKPSVSQGYEGTFSEMLKTFHPASVC
jgi:hypothetical protein